MWEPVLSYPTWMNLHLCPSPMSSHLPRGRVFKTECFLKDISYGGHKTWPTMSHQVMVSEVEESLDLGQDGVTGDEGAVPLPEVF